ncbi:sodium/hydrogen exchanger 10 [Plakobranchus ocellatus]|uniref:Sodium/hydrogen exchanger 10 n=1 Tax=Plakobranchus ocellatus TaxID=259542 RepID=A0AAV3YYU5_9GAST|nr:sodium/hydrogen exchanger 10 [Plakobranchus ocellatus]
MRNLFALVVIVVPRSFADADWHTVAKFTELKHPLITLPATSTQDRTSISPAQEESRSIRRILTIAKKTVPRRSDVSQRFKTFNPVDIPGHRSRPKLKKFGKQYSQLLAADSASNALRACFLMLHFVDCVFTVLALFNVLVADIPSRNFFFLIYNIIFVFFHLMWILVRSLIKKRMDLIDLMIIPIIMVGVLDISVLQVITKESNTARVLRTTCVLTRLLRPFRVSGMFLVTLKPLMFICDRLVSQRLMDGYDIARSYIQARLEIIRLISHMEDVPDYLQSKYKVTLKHHKIEVLKTLGVMQLHCPSTLTTAKTRQASRIVLKRQEYIVNNIQQSRALGEDGAILERVILLSISNINTSKMKLSHPDSSDIIINVPWIKDLHEVYVQVMEKGVKIHFKKNDTIVSQYEDPNGIFIILSGLVWVQRENSAERGQVSFVTVDYLSSGNVIGEFTFLTGKPRHKTFGCYTDVVSLYIRSNFLHDIMGGRPDIMRSSLSKLEEKMWRVVALRIALRLLMAEPTWLPWSQNQILMRLVDSVLVDGSDTDKTFNEWVSEHEIVLIQGKQALVLDEIVLIQGKVLDLSSTESLSAPAYIPKQRMSYAFMVKCVCVRLGKRPKGDVEIRLLAFFGHTCTF